MAITLAIHGIPDDFGELDVRDLCEEFGELRTLRLHLPTGGGRPWAEVSFALEWDAELAMSELDGAEVEGSYLRVDVHEPVPGSEHAA